MRTVLNRYDDHANGPPPKSSALNLKTKIKDDGVRVTNDKNEGNEDNELTFRFDPGKMPQPIVYENRTNQDDAMRTVLNRFDDHPNPALAKK